MTDLPYRAIWERELRAGMYGQDRMKPSTWKIDGLYHATCWQARAEDMEQMIAEAMDRGAHVDSIAGLLQRLEFDKDMAHKAFLDWERQHGAKPAA